MKHRPLTTQHGSAKTGSNREDRRASEVSAPEGTPGVDGNSRWQLIAAEAYLLAQRRDFAPGCELDDWLAAEALVENRLRDTNTSKAACGPDRR